MADRIVDPGTGVSIREMAGREGSDQGNRETRERSFLCRGNIDPQVCRQALINQKVPLELEDFDGLGLQSLSWQLYAGEQDWQFDASYSWEPSPGNYTISMDSTGGQIKIYEAYSQTRYDAPGVTGPDYGTTINVDRKGDAQGVERVIPALKLNINAKLSTGIAADPLAYSKIVANLTGTINSVSYLTFAPGELLFMGATGEIVGENPSLVYTFAASPNLTGLDVGPITGVAKGGHDYIWVTYKTVKSNGRNAEVPISAYVGKIYGAADPSGLGIGV